ncbi:hypothetical protein GQ53DRAFT_787287 [Thozetella sp. PMI_491]|nr:hypothetical protein GQ53DRAFT_787287 [Thozetella sp. PMI_491]
MSASGRSTPSPLQAASSDPVDESQMPRGHCRYILLLPEIKGQRCACVNFTLNKGIPGATCDCGHLACFHNRDSEPSAEQKQELELLKKRVKLLEEQMNNEHDDVVVSLGSRLTEMEEQVEKTREELKDEFRRSYQNVSLSWRSIDQLQQRNQQYDAQFAEVDARLGNHSTELKRLDELTLELADADASLEERLDEALDELEEQDDQLRSPRGRDRRPRRRSTSDTTHPNHPLGPLAPLGLGVGSASAVPTLMSFRALRTPAPPQGPWTVHVSLLPQSNVAMPFERNTTAYLRCLSRGLHRMVAIAAPDAESFVTAVSKAFSSHLRGREWVPLQAKLCDAEQLQGLPMLRQLDPSLLNEPYDAEFLRKNCAVCDPNGMMDSLYISMKRHTLSWNDVKQAPVYMEGLESSWDYDKLLDAVPSDVDTVVAGDIVAISTSLKRSAQEMAKPNGFGAGGTAAAENEGPRTKRTCPLPPKPIPGIRRQGVETA